MPRAIITGASRGLGQALARALVAKGWELVIDGRDGPALTEAGQELLVAGARQVRAIAGDVASAAHRRALLAAAGDRLDVLVNNASTLGPSPLPALAEYPLEDLEHVYRVNTLAPLALAQLALPLLRASRGRILNITSDAAVEAYEGWGGYGSSKAALEHLSAVMATEEPAVRLYWVDPGDLRTAMHQEAFPGEDISDRPPPEVAVPGLLELVEGDWPSGRYKAQALAAAEAAP